MGIAEGTPVEWETSANGQNNPRMDSLSKKKGWPPLCLVTFS
jgi:hypothetical protein